MLRETFKRLLPKLVSKLTWGGLMITISKGMAAVLVSALRDASKHTSDRIEASAVGDVSDLEENLIHLGNLEADVHEQYERLANLDPKMIPYEKLWRDEG